MVSVMSPAEGEGGQPGGAGVLRGQPVPQPGQCQPGAQAVGRKDGQRCPQENVRRPGRDQPVQPEQQRRQPLDGDDAQHTPDRRGRQTDVSVQIEPAAGIIPPAGVGIAFQPVPGHPFHRCGVKRAAQEQKKPSPGQFLQADRDNAAGDAVDQAQRTVEHPPVPVPPLPQRGVNHFQHPAQKREGKKQPDQLVKHKIPLSCHSQRNTPMIQDTREQCKIWQNSKIYSQVSRWPPLT